MSLIGIVLVEHSMLLLLKNLTIEGQKTQLLPLHATAQLKAATEAAISIGVAGSGSGTGLKSEKSLPSASFKQLICSAFVQETND